MNDFLLFRSIKNNPSNILFLTCFPTAMNANFTPFPLSLPVGGRTLTRFHTNLKLLQKKQENTDMWIYKLHQLRRRKNQVDREVHVHLPSPWVNEGEKKKKGGGEEIVWTDKPEPE